VAEGAEEGTDHDQGDEDAGGHAVGGAAGHDKGAAGGRAVAGAAAAASMMTGQIMNIMRATQAASPRPCKAATIKAPMTTKGSLWESIWVMAGPLMSRDWPLGGSWMKP